jgi:hypothetical protein
MKMSRALAILLAAMAILLLSPAKPCFAQSASNDNPRSFPESRHIIGLAGLGTNVSGNLLIENGSLTFAHGGKKVSVPISSITEVITGKDTERTIGGTVGTLTMFAPYGSGRFLSLFRTRIDHLSLTYVDSSGGIHGAIFTLQEGNAWSAKKALVDQGAKTSIPVEKEVEEQTRPKGKKQ